MQQRAKVTIVIVQEKPSKLGKVFCILHLSKKDGVFVADVIAGDQQITFLFREDNSLGLRGLTDLNPVANELLTFHYSWAIRPFMRIIWNFVDGKEVNLPIDLMEADY